MTRARFVFDSLESAAHGLETVLLDARETAKTYFFSGASADQILKSGLILEGDIASVSKKLNKITGSDIFME